MACLENKKSEMNNMCMARAMILLHTFRDLLRSYQPDSEIADALDTVFEWIDEAVLLSKRSGKDAPEDDPA